MFDNNKLIGCRNLLAKVLIAGSVFLLPMENAFAAANLNTSSASFTSADPARTNSYMDAGGVWNGSADVSNVGDTFTLTIANTANGLPVPADDIAFDLQDVIVSVDAGFLLSSSSLNVNNVVGLPTCPNISVGIAQQQPVGAGNPIRLNIGNNVDIEPGCSYELSFGLTTTNTVAAGTHPVSYAITYTDDGGTTVNLPDVVQNIDVNTGAILLDKTTTESNPANGDTVDFNVNIQNPGSGGLFDVSLTDLLGTGLSNINITPLAGSPAGSLISATEYRFFYVDPGANFNVRVRATTNFSLASATCPTLSNTASIDDRTSIVVPDSSVSIPFNLGALSVTHLNTSRCVLCGTGTVTLRLTNASGVDVDNLVITEDLLASELLIVDATSTFGGAGIANPVQGVGPTATQYTWTLNPAQTVPANSSVDLVFTVAYDTAIGINEDLARNNTTISASVVYDLSCGVTQPAAISGNFLLILDQPLPQVSKLVRNVDANQAAYAPTTFGHQGDDVIWQVSVQNTGPTNMQDVVLNDTVSGNFVINYVCPTSGDADLAAAGTPPGSCVSTGGVTTINNFEMNFPFGAAGAGGGDDVLAGTTELVFYVGKVTATCGVETNTNNIEWGCDVDGTLGGLNSAQILAGGTDDTADATLSTSDSGAIGASSVTHTVRGIDGGPEIGSRGIVTITVTNDTGGTIRDVIIDDVLPTSYVVDNTFTPTFIFTPAYGVYGGQSDQIANDIDTIPANLLNNIAPQFILTSDDTGDNPLVDVNLFRHGDSFTITFQIVLVDPTRFDLVADLEFLTEEVAPGADPDNTFSINNDLTITYDDTCDFSPDESYNQTPAFPVFVEDLDVSISDALFILTNDPGTPLNLNVDVTNNGGHVADNYTVYITLGEAMTEDGLPGICVPTTNLPPHPTWNDPAEIPAGAAVYACTPGPIAPANTVTITIPVIKAAAAAIDDLTFRADVIGEVTLFGGTALDLPAPPSLPKTTPNLQLANNYTLDAVRSRVLGFNLVKSVWYCAENDPLELQPAPPADMLSPLPGAPVIPPLTGNLNSQIGEDCAYRIESGGWFGFVTPGFALIEVKNVAVTDVLPTGQGLIQYDTAGGKPFNFSNTLNIVLADPVTGGADTTPLSTTDITWLFNTAAGINVADEFFRVDFKTRLLNDNIDLDYSLPLAGPNLHGNPSTNIATSSFTAVFQSDPIAGVPQPLIDINVSDTDNNPLGYIEPPGYPDPLVRTISLTDVEPNLIVTKQVCNESLSDQAGTGGFGPGCNGGVFSDSVNDGDTNDSYIYRITLTNQVTTPIRSPAFNVISTDTLGSGISDLMVIVDFETDGLDNDGDGVADGADAADEAALFASIPNNIIGDGVPAVITVDETYNTRLLQVDSGDSIEFYYRVDPDQTIAPLQTLTNRVSMSYDSLDDDFGNQNIPQLDNSATAPDDAGRARIYTSIEQSADVQMIPLLAQPKTVVQLSNTTLAGAPHNVSVGEEIRYLLVADLPVANLKSFKIRDELPAGIRCIEGQEVNLDAAPYDVAGFDPGGTFLSTCTSTGLNDYVEWNFGTQAITNATLPGLRINFPITFIARVENSAATTEGATLTNGGGTVNTANPPSLLYCTGGVAVCYVNDTNNVVSLDFAPVDIVVREPLITLSKSFLPVINSDAADVLTVTVRAENNPTLPANNAAAYNLQVMDNLVGSGMTYIVGSEGGLDKPDFVDTSVANRPVFSWDRNRVTPSPDYEIAQGTFKEFTFQVRVDTTVQPLELLDNTIEAKWDSLPGQDVALPHILTPAGIGLDGSAMGLRNGAVPNIGAPANAPNDYETTATASTSVLPLTMTKTDLDVGVVVPTIGAHRNFEVVINLPEGTTENLIVDDVLVFGGISYVLSRNASFDVSYTFEDIISINGQPPAEAVFLGATAGPPTLPVDDDSGTITWDIGQIITDEEDDYDGVANAVNPRIIINYFARPNNDAATNVGVDLRNSATVTYDNGEDATTETLNAVTAVQTVLEPDLAITKAVSNITNPGFGPVGGDVLEYQISIINNGNSTAFDSNIVDTLPVELLFDPSFTPTATITGIGAVPGFVAIPSGATVGPLVWGRNNIENTPADNTLDIPVGETLVLTYHTLVQTSIQPNVVLSNSALVDWTSLNDTDPSNAFERTGAGCPNVLAPNDYCSAPAVANITANDTNSIVKTVIFDTYDEAPLSTAFDSIVRIGDTVTYQLDVNLQQGTTTSVNILDSVPGGMAFVDVVSINGATTAPYASPVSGPGSNFSYTPILATDVPTAGDTGPIFNWAIGTVANDAAGDPTTDTLVIIYRARVVDNVAATIPQQSTTTLTNTADLTYIDGIGNPSPGGLNDSADIFVLQPVMDALSKTDRLTRPSGITVNVATDVMEFRLHTCNTTGLARAYGLLMTDTLPMQMNEASITGPTNGALAPDVLIDGVLATAGSDYVYTPPAVRGGNMLFRFNTPIDPGECVDIDFNMGFYTDFGANQSWSNTVAVNEYYSLPPADAQLYSIVLPEVFNMNNLGTTFPPPEKTMVTPAPALPEATVGDDVIYEIRVPQTPANAIMYDVTVTDTLHASLFYEVGSVIDIGTSAFAITDNTVPGSNNIDLFIDQIPAGQQAIIRISARVDNNLSANAGVSFVNSATYMFANTPAGVPILGGTDSTASLLNIIEPAVAVAKSVVNTTKPGAPDAGDVLRYTITLTASGGGVVPADFFSNAFDLSIDDTLSLGLLYLDGTETVTPGSTINLPVKVGDGITIPQSLSWSLAQANADIDVTEGTTVTVTYDVLVLDSVLADQNLSNTVDIQWSSRDGPDVNERDGSGVPPLNDYFNLVSAVTLETTPDSNTIVKSRLSDTYNPLDNIVRIGDIVEYQLLINLQEGTHPNFVVQDTLPEGLIFEQTVSINGQTVAPYPAVAPFTHTAIPAAVVVGDPVTGPTTVTWNAGDVINAGDNNITNDDFVIVYRARVLNLALPQLPTSQPLTNNVNFDYAMASGVAPTKTSSQPLDLQQPDLSVTKTSLPVAGSVIGANDLVTYTVQIFNNGNSPAYDTELLDTIPFGLRSPAITMVSMSLLSGTPLPAVPLAPAYDPATGTANWNFDTGTADQYNIPAGDTLQIVYQLQADAGLGAGLTMTNAAQVQFYYSFDNDAVPSVPPITGVREIYGPSNTAQVTLTTVLPNALLKINPTDLDASIGESFTYRITVPETPQATALYDVQILDDLTASAADLRFDSVAAVGVQPWTPVNIGTVADNLIIADVTNGIDIPAFGQIAVDITVTLRNISPPNDAPLPFANAASYTFNQVNGDNTTVSAGLGNTTPVMTIVEPDLSLVKTGPVGTVNFLAPIPYTVVVSNNGTGPAFDTTIVDQLPDVPDPVIPVLTGGTCDATPININARITAVDEVTVIRSLLLNTDYTATHTAAPTCELVITTLTDTARIEVTEKLVVSYETTLDVGTQSGAALTNIAGVTRWFSLDTAGAGATDEIREYTSIATDSATVIVEAPVLDVQKTVMNVTTTQNPGDNATPGDILRYTIVITNNGLVDANAVTLSDAIPANATYIADTVTLNTLPVGQPDGGVSPLVAGIDISSSDLLPPTPGNGTITVGETATVTFDILLNPVITSGTVISNQAIVDSPSTGTLPSDDPIAPGTADPTTTLITSAPAFVVQKTSLDITGDPAILLPGDTLRYTLTVKNIGLEDAVNSLLADQIPANTTYVANSTRLNAVVVADPAAGISPLAAGMLINAPENTTAGYLRADTNAAANNVATITFDVLVNLTAVSGTIISNQGFFNGSGAGSGVFPQQPSDDPSTALVDDPTIDVVGNVPVINSLKIVALENDVNLNGFVDPGDTLRYTITTTNIGAMPATNVVLTDDLDDPFANQITYVPGSGLLNGLPAGVSFTAPVLTATIGDLLPANSAVVVFDVTVDAGVLPGTIISNQGSVASNELPIELTDADGNPANGYQTTDVVVGNVEQLAISKQVTVVGGGAAEPGKQLEYIVRVTNIGAVAAQNVVISDIFDPAVMTYVGGSGLLDGLVAGVSFDDTTDPLNPILTADYSAIYGDLPVAAVTELRFRVTLDASLSIGFTVSNTAVVIWDVTVPQKTANASVSIDIGGIPGSANINGQVWHDTDFSNDVGVNEAVLPDYRVELYRNGILLANAVTDVNGVFLFSGLPPNTIADPYEVRFIAPGATAATATLGTTNSAFTDGPQRITNIIAASGDNIQNLNLPRQVNGIVYDSVLRVPVAGVQLTMINQTRSNQVVPSDCFDDPIQANQVTPASGYYKFDLNFSDPARCARGDEYEIQVLPPADDFTGTTSVIIPPVEPVTGAALDVPSCPNTAADKITATTEHCENSASDLPAPATVPPRTPATDYHLKFVFSDVAPGTPFTDQIFNNHIPVDGILEAAVAISKVAGKLNVTRSDLVPYTITFNNTLGVPLFDVSIIDNFPAGFKYVTGSARVDGAEMEPQVNGRLLTWPGLSVGIDESRVIKLLLIVGSGVGEGEYVNQAWAINTLTAGELSGVATATVRVIPDPTFDCTDIIGKVFDDKNLNGYQDDGETGLPGVQVATARGLRITTDSHGRFHITCAIVANEVRGSNFIMKLDDRTLPSGYRVTTENPRVQRATRGKMMKFNFGTAIHRVVRLDLADGVFEKGSTELRPQWRSRIELLITELQKEGSILRLSYLAENESEGEVDDRLDAIEELVSDRWQELDCCYKLTIEKEVFWRKGSPSAGREFAE